MSEELKTELDLSNAAPSGDLLNLAHGIVFKEEDADTEPNAGVDPIAKPDEKPAAKPVVDAKSADLPDDLMDADPAKKPEAAAEVEAQFPEPKGLDQNSSTAFKAMRQKIAELTQKASTAGNSESAELKAKLADYESKIEMFDVMASERFTKTFVTPLRDTFKQITDIGAAHQIKPELMRQIAARSVADRDQDLSNLRLTPATLARLVPLFDKLSDQRATYDTAMKDSKATTERIRREEQELSVKQQGEGIESAVAKLQEGKHFLLRDSVKNPQWLPRLKEEARKILSGKLSRDEMAAMALRAVTSDYYKDMYLRDVQAVREELATTKSASDKAKGLRPRLGGDASTAAAGGQKKTFKTVDELADSLG